MNANFPEIHEWPAIRTLLQHGADDGPAGKPGPSRIAAEYTPYYTQENIAAMTNGDPTDGWDNVDYIDKVFGTGTNQKHSVTCRAATKRCVTSLRSAT